MVIKMLTKLRRQMNGYTENCHKEIENTSKYQTEVRELQNSITELKNILEGFNNSRLDEADQQPGKQGHGTEQNKAAKKKKKEF